MDETKETRAPKINLGAIIGLVLIMLFLGYKYLLPKIDTSWVVDAAVAEVKSDVYRDYGEIPSLNGRIIYQDKQNYIVAVTYRIPEYSWKASCACRVYGYREDNVSVIGMTSEMPYDYDYRAHLEELKAMWGLD